MDVNALFITELAVISIEVLVLIALYFHLRSLKEHSLVLEEHMKHLEEHVEHMEKSIDELDRKLKGHYQMVTGMFDELDEIMESKREED